MIVIEYGKKQRENAEKECNETFEYVFTELHV